jgi:UDP-glucose 4-epimerase
MSVLVTGAAGFIGSHVCHALLARGEIAPTTPISVGVPKFVHWYREFYRV